MVVQRRRASPFFAKFEDAQKLASILKSFGYDSESQKSIDF